MRRNEFPKMLPQVKRVALEKPISKRQVIGAMVAR